ncbi:MAG TPA: LysR family transcriptional regulator [Chloroflexota bacterium]|nr:LysR family transcriptional regulator [Chloroflexota bacterium]
MSFTLVQLATFVRVAALGNFSRAAEDLDLTQPGVTRQVRALERNFGVRLVDVVGRRPVLTDAGRFLAARAADLLGSAAALEREMDEFARVQGGELHLGATLTIGAYVLPGLLTRFGATYPGVRVRVEVANTPAIAASVRSGRLGLALVEGPLEDPTLEIVPFQSERLKLVVPAGHRLARRTRVSAGDLAGEPFVWREPGSGTRALAEEALAAAGVTPRVVLELPSGEGVARAVEAGMGLTILSPLVVARAVAAGDLALVEIADVDLRRTFRLVCLRGRTLSPAAQALASLARQTDGTPGT